MNRQIILAIGRWMPLHLGHKKFLVDLAKKYDKLIIGIGSCYENGTERGIFRGPMDECSLIFPQNR